jgi:hypothetical protein
VTQIALGNKVSQHDKLVCRPRLTNVVEHRQDSRCGDLVFWLETTERFPTAQSEKQMVRGGHQLSSQRGTQTIDDPESAGGGGENPPLADLQL